MHLFLPSPHNEIQSERQGRGNTRRKPAYSRKKVGEENLAFQFPRFNEAIKQ